MLSTTAAFYAEARAISPPYKLAKTVAIREETGLYLCWNTNYLQ